MLLVQECIGKQLDGHAALIPAASQASQLSVVEMQVVNFTLAINPAP